MDRLTFRDRPIGGAAGTAAGGAPEPSQTPVRLSFAITDLDVGGAERMLTELVLRLDRRRWTPSVVCLRPPGPLAERLTGAGVPVHCLGVRSPSDLPRALWLWNRVLRTERPALLQTFLFHANLLGRIVGRWARVPVIVNGIRVAQRQPRWRLECDRWTHGLADGHVCVSQGVRRFALRDLGIPAERLVVIPNGIDVEQWPDPSRRSDAGPLVLVSIGRLDRQKGYDDLLQALHILARRLILPGRLRVDIVGVGPRRRSLEHTVLSLGLSLVVRFVGWQSDPERWLASADGLVLASRWEGMPNVVLEAMALSRPVIATSVEGTRELVIDGRTGWTVPPGQPDRLAEAIGDFLEGRDRHGAMGQAGRQLVAEHYSLNSMVSRYDELYSNLLGFANERP